MCCSVAVLSGPGSDFSAADMLVALMDPHGHRNTRLITNNLLSRAPNVTLFMHTTCQCAPPSMICMTVHATPLAEHALYVCTSLGVSLPSCTAS